MFTKEQIDFLDTQRVYQPYQKFIAEAKRAFKRFFDNAENYDRVNQNIQVLMPLRGFNNTTELSSAVGLNTFYIARLLRKEFPYPSIESISSIAKVLDVKPSTLLLVSIRQELEATVRDIKQWKDGVE